MRGPGVRALVEVLAVPNSKRESLEYDGNTLKARIKEPPEKGKANRAVIKLVSRVLGECELVSGFTSKRKTLWAKTQTLETIKPLLESLGWK
ncbi:MAG: DUF167 family protein [Candidatus Altiarchaeota archaeon]|nr:DUF167 family protein [Candidatus Altiarchaeota archaeon]